MVSGSEQWQLDQDSVGCYERYSRFMLEPWVPALISAAGVRPGDRVLDVACGTGFVARQAARCAGPSGRVVGVDINAAMLAMARRTGVSGEVAAVDWLEADVGALPFPDGCFDVALCQQGLQFFPDRVGALREMYRTLVPGGRVALSVWGSMEENPYFQAKEAAIRRHVDTAAAEGLHRPHALADPEAVREALVSAGFADIRVRREATSIRTPPARAFLPGHLSAMPIAAKIAALPGAARHALVEDLCTALRPFADADGLRLPCVVHIASARVLS